jgi:F420-0:gamma-glutamyl ligase-like protein
MYRLAALEKVRMAFDTLLRAGCDVTAMQTKGDATYSLLLGLLTSLGVNKMITLLLCR